MIGVYKYGSDTGRAITEKLLSRNKLDYKEAQTAVEEIINNVKISGDAALYEYTKKFDKVSVDNFKVSSAEIGEAYKLVDGQLKNIITEAATRIKSFHEKQKQRSFFEPETNGELLGQVIRPIEKAGVYVPGGTAFYPSSVIMNVMPAKVAGVEKIVMVTPPGGNGKVNPLTIVAAIESGVTEIYKVGGAQAIAALAYGTESIPKVDKIVGPGNIFVALAKKMVYGVVGIDSIAGPSEILIIADSSAKPEYVAADLLSQAEHDALASAILITDSARLAKEVQEEVEKQASRLSRKGIIEESLKNYGAVIIVESIEEAIKFSNQIAPEHLEICIKDPFSTLSKIKNAGAIFLGDYTPEPIGDYLAGPNHVLPTNGTARFFSALSVD
ncbi:MAG: histidinol dehydrogenase, partial [Clostridiales bacterium]|nr:histidinol dehydrogenase [Clostridiales bacterium]